MYYDMLKQKVMVVVMVEASCGSRFDAVSVSSWLTILPCHVNILVCLTPRSHQSSSPTAVT